MNKITSLRTLNFMNTQKFKIVKLIFYLAIVVVFFIIRITYKNSKADETYTFEDIIGSGNTTIIQEDIENNELIDYESNSKVDTELFTDLTENESYGDEVPITFKITNGAILYDMKLPLGIFDNMLEEYQLYFNSIVVDAPITEVTIIEESILISSEILSYEIETNLKSKISVTVDLYSFQYYFKLI